VEAGGRTYVVKRALPGVRGAKIWEAPVARSEAGWKWLNFVRAIVPNAVPRGLSHEADAAMIASQYLETQRYPVWKQQLFDGSIDPKVAATVGRITARIHAASSGDSTVASQFQTRDAFHALRIEPYLLEAARQNPSVSNVLNALAEQTLQT